MGNDDMLVLTPSALLSFLSQIEELKDKDIDFIEGADGLTVTIDENQYVLDASNAAEVEIDEESLIEVEEANDDGYNQLGDEVEEDIEIQGDEPVEGGIIKELIKTLAVGGLVRLTKDAIMKS